MNLEELVARTSHIANGHPSRLVRSAQDPVTQETIHRVLLAAMAAIRLELQAGGYVRINALGTLSTFRREAYQRPINLPGFAGRVETIPAKQLVRFKASADLLAFINQPPSEEEEPAIWQPPEREIDIDILTIPNMADKRHLLDDREDFDNYPDLDR